GRRLDGWWLVDRRVTPTPESSVVDLLARVARAHDRLGEDSPGWEAHARCGDRWIDPVEVAKVNRLTSDRGEPRIEVISLRDLLDRHLPAVLHRDGDLG